MSETINFHFEGALADSHCMNFYEAARFQYAASRLIVKLAKFRDSGKFPEKITTKSNFNIQLQTQSKGSFNINIDDKSENTENGPFVDMSLSDLLAYVIERVIEKIDENALTPSDSSGSDGAHSYLLDRIVNEILDGTKSTLTLSEPDRDLVRRRIAEFTREKRLMGHQAALSKIDPARSQKLISMSAPLIKEMTTALRESAKTLEILTPTEGQNRPVLFLNREMASAIETARVDNVITTFLGDITQFNKDNGWGKLKIDNGLRTVSFSIPFDILPAIKQQLIDNMKRDLVNLKTYCVRDRSGEISRLIVVDILPTPTT